MDKKSFCKGILSVFYIQDNTYKKLYYKYVKQNPSEVNIKAIKSDWNAVGSDIQQALTLYEQKLENNNI